MSSKKMSLLDLKALVEAEKYDALAAVASADLSWERARAMDYFLGDLEDEFPAPEGRSETVSTDVSDTIEGMMPNLMEIFAGSDEVVRFEPDGPNDEDAAQQETDYVNWVFMQQNPGFMVLYSFVKDALLSKVGIVKVWWEEKEQEERETYYGLSDDQFMILANEVQQSDGELRIIEHTIHNGPEDEPDDDEDKDEKGDEKDEDDTAEDDEPSEHNDEDDSAHDQREDELE